MNLNTYMHTNIHTKHINACIYRQSTYVLTFDALIGDLFDASMRLNTYIHTHSGLTFDALIGDLFDASMHLYNIYIIYIYIYTYTLSTHL
jgi:hypothetical protein